MKNIIRISGVTMITILIQACTKEVDNTIRDIDGNVYTSVTIGTQVWMVENLKTTKYLNGDLIGTTNPDTLDITLESTPKYQWAYEGNESNVNTYGRLYTWYAITDTRNVCPIGYHIPTDTEWTTLTDYLINNGYGYQGSGNDIGKSMAATSGWGTDPTEGNLGNDQEGNNSSGFTALPSGSRDYFGSFWDIGYVGRWWSSTEASTMSTYYRGMSAGYSNVLRYDLGKQNGFSVRCLRDK